MTLPVTDTTKAGQIVEVLLRAEEEAIVDATQRKMASAIFRSNLLASFVAITPTIALSDRILIAGLNPVSVEEAIKHARSSSSELADSQTYTGSRAPAASAHELFCLHRYGAVVFATRRFAAADVVNGCGIRAGGRWLDRSH